MEQSSAAVVALALLLLVWTSSSSATYYYENHPGCTNPGAPRNGYRRGWYFRIGGYVRYGCNPGYRLIGHEWATCVPYKWYSARWSCSLPLCTPIKLPLSACGQPPKAGRYAVLSTYNSTSVSYRCRSKRFVRANGDKTLLCKMNRRWTGTPLSCRKKAKCSRLQWVRNGFKRNKNRREGDTVVFTCRDGYVLVGASRLTCLSSGYWSHPVPKCIADCGDPGIPANGKRIRFDGTRQGSIVQYKCNRGFVRKSGNLIRMCISISRWYGLLPVCGRVDCGKPRKPLNGYVNYTSTLFESTAVYRCKTGYQLVGKVIIVCLSHGQWSSTKTRCDAIQCPEPSRPKNGHVKFKRRTFGSVATYCCNSGYQLVGPKTRKCSLKGTWTPGLPTCQRKVVECGRLLSPANGSVSFNSTRVSSIASYSCNSGFTLQGAQTRVCMQSGRWSGKSPLCVAVLPNCSLLTNPDNGRVDFNDTSVGSIAVYSCTFGYRVSNTSNKRECLSTGIWSGDEPICIRIDCPPLPNPPNGEVIIVDGSFALYTCNIGFNLVGERNRSCQLGGTWFGLAPECTIVDCNPLTNPMNGVVSFVNTTFGSVANYTCNRGYFLSGNETRICQANGLWSFEAPKCIPDIIDFPDCGALADPSNGFVFLSNTTIGSIATYSCDEGFVLMGVSNRTCLGTGSWSDEAPTCVVVRCEDLDSPANGSVSLNDTSVGSLAVYACDANFVLFGENVRICQSNGKWNSTSPSCQVVNCGPPPLPANGSVEFDNTLFNAEVKYVCDRGFKLSGVTTRRCLDTGRWSGNTPICNVVDCGLLTPVPNGTVQYLPDGRTTFGAVAQYLCSPGHNLEGNSLRVCLENGSWNGTEPFCRPVDCGTLESPANGSVEIESTSLNGVARYNCDAGFTLDGAEQQTCTQNGTWSGSPPVCIIANCNPLAAPVNGSVTVRERRVGSIATYSCNTGFTLSGPSTRECTDAGNWTGQAPICIDNLSVDCGRPRVPTNGQLLISTTTLGSVARYFCNLPYRVEGERVRRCLVNGSWSGSVPTCVLIDCGVPEMPENGMATFPNTRFGAIATYRCSTGYNLIGTMTRICGSLGVWSGRVPRCQIVDCGNPGTLENGRVFVFRTTFEGTATFVCNAGFRLDGDRQRVCLASGEWTGSVPTCIDERADCGDPGTPQNGIRTLSGTRQGDRVDYSCNSGFRLNGDRQRQCQSTGAWSGALPTCERKVCEDPGVPSGGRRINGNFSLGEVVYFVCMDDYDLVGSNARRCQENCTWSGIQPVCVLRNTSCNTTGSTFDGVGRTCECVDGQLRNCCRIREDWTSLPSSRKAIYIQTVKDVSSDPLYQPRYRDIMSLFAESENTLAQGRRAETSQKLPWNRFFLREYEDLLRMVSSSVTIPFWDWTISNTDPYRHPVFDPLEGFGNSSGENNCVNSGPFRVGQFNLTPIAGGGCLTREYQRSEFLPRSGLVQVVLPYRAQQFNLFFQRTAFLPYLNVRCSVGGVMCGGNAAEDPLYVLSAAFVDKVWDQWQGQSEDRLRARYANDNSTLVLADTFRVLQFSDNSRLPSGVSVCYGPLVPVGSRGGAGGQGGYYHRGGEGEGRGEGGGEGGGGRRRGGGGRRGRCLSKDILIKNLGLTESEINLYRALCPNFWHQTRSARSITH